MSSTFERHFLGPLVVFISLILGEVGIRYLNFPITLAIPYAILSLTVFYWSGLRAALVSALLISLYPFLLHYELYGFYRAAAAALGAFLIAGPSGILKRGFRENVLEAEHLKRRAEVADNLNGNLKKVIEALDILNHLRANFDVLTKTRILEEINAAREPLITLSTLIRSWEEINEAKEKAFAYLDQMAGYPYRADEAIREIRALQTELLNRVDYLGKLVERQDKEK